jgi:hypothetical protein
MPGMQMIPSLRQIMVCSTCGGSIWERRFDPVTVLKMTSHMGMFKICLNCGCSPDCGSEDRKYRRKWIKKARRVIKKMKAEAIKISKSIPKQ